MFPLHFDSILFIDGEKWSGFEMLRLHITLWAYRLFRFVCAFIPRRFSLGCWHRTMAAPRAKLKMSFNSVSSMSESDAAGLWQHLKGSITQIFAENASQLSFEVLHRYG